MISSTPIGGFSAVAMHQTETQGGGVGNLQMAGGRAVYGGGYPLVYGQGGVSVVCRSTVGNIGDIFIFDGANFSVGTNYQNIDGGYWNDSDNVVHWNGNSLYIKGVGIPIGDTVVCASVPSDAAYLAVSYGGISSGIVSYNLYIANNFGVTSNIILTLTTTVGNNPPLPMPVFLSNNQLCVYTFSGDIFFNKNFITASLYTISVKNGVLSVSDPVSFNIDTPFTPPTSSPGNYISASLFPSKHTYSGVSGITIMEGISSDTEVVDNYIGGYIGHTTSRYNQSTILMSNTFGFMIDNLGNNISENISSGNEVFLQTTNYTYPNGKQSYGFALDTHTETEYIGLPYIILADAPTQSYLLEIQTGTHTQDVNVPYTALANGGYLLGSSPPSETDDVTFEYILHLSGSTVQLGSNNPQSTSIAHDDTYVYVSIDDKVYSAPLKGGNVSVIQMPQSINSLVCEVIH